MQIVADQNTKRFIIPLGDLFRSPSCIAPVRCLEISRILSRSSQSPSEREGKSVRRAAIEYARAEDQRPWNWIVGLCETRAFRAFVGRPLRVHPASSVCIVMYAPRSRPAHCTRVMRGTHSQQWRCVGGKVLLIANTANISATSDAAQRCAIMRQLLTRLDYAVEVASAEPRAHLGRKRLKLIHVR